MKYISDSQPKRIQKIINNNIYSYRIIYDNDFVDGVYICNYVIVDDINYDIIVDSIINDIYPHGKMTAIINNYLLPSHTEEDTLEFNAMQEKRLWVKGIAKEVIKEMGNVR